MTIKINSFFSPAGKWCSFFLSIACSALAFTGSDSISVKHLKIVSADSAAILCPRQFTILDKESVEYTVKPACPVSAVDLLVHYYPFKTDTLARLGTAPFSVAWHYASLPDQDQLNLQFGYILYQSDGDTIISPPMPHRWVIDRSAGKSPQRYSCKQVAAGDTIVIDGKLGEWRRFLAAPFGAGCRFRCCWTPPDFFFAAEVYDTCVTIFDRIELCFDLQQTRTPFFTIDHRIIAFGPRSRSFCWAVDIADTGVTLLDSIIMLVKEQTEWRSRLTEDGYIIEGRIPFFTLSALEFPPKRFGFDIAVIDRDTLNLNNEAVYSWSKCKPSSLHNPSEWGTLMLRQLFLPLKLLLVISFFFIIAMIVLMVVLIIDKKRRDYQYEKIDETVISPAMKSIMKIIEDSIGKTGLAPDDVARAYGFSVSDLEKTCAHELHTSCSKIITMTRIKKAKTCLMGFEMKLDEVAHAAGFADTATFTRVFKSYAGVYPLQWKENRIKDSLGDEEEAAAP